MLRWLIHLLFPPKCVLCRRILQNQETDLCHTCRADAPEFTKSKRKIPFVAQWTGIWYYNGNVRGSIHRYKFANARRYAAAYARALAVQLQKEEMDSFDILSWIPVSRSRKRKRGYDQGQLLAEALGQELGCAPVAVLKKYRNNPPQSSLSLQAERRANVMNVYAVTDPGLIRGKRILLVDDVVTTGATASECGKTLLIYGAKEITLATVAVAVKN